MPENPCRFPVSIQSLMIQSLSTSNFMHCLKNSFDFWVCRSVYFVYFLKTTWEEAVLSLSRVCMLSLSFRNYAQEEAHIMNFKRNITRSEKRAIRCYGKIF